MSATPARTEATTAANGTRRSSFQQMRLRVGDSLNLELPRLLDKVRATVNLVGWYDRHCIITTAPQNDRLRSLLLAEEGVLLRTFSVRSAFAFKATVQKLVTTPFHHLYLSYPEEVEEATIRNSSRCRVDLPAKLNAGDAEHDCLIRDLSCDGALVETAVELQKNDRITRLAASFELHGVPVSFELAADVRSVKSATPAGGDAPHQYGVQFCELKPSDRLLLGGLVSYRILEPPASAT